MSGTTGSSTGSSDVSLNDLSANHNNELFANAVADSCVDALAQMDLFPPPEQALEDGTLQDDDSSSKPKPKEDKQFLLADNTGYVDVMGETENLWNKAITTLSKNKAETPKMLPNSSTYEDLDTNGVAGKTLGKGEFAKKKSAYDMSPIMLDGDITGGEAPGMSDNDNKKGRKVIPSSDYSIDGESAMLWGDDPENAYFKYMMEQEAEARALEGKDQDDSLMAESARQELLNNTGYGGGNSSLEDDTTLGHGSKAIGWEPSTIAGGPSTIAGGQLSTLTPSHNPSGSQKAYVKNGQLIIPNVIYVQDGTDPDPQAQARNWNNSPIENFVANDPVRSKSPTNNKSKRTKEVPEQPRRSSSHRQSGASKAATKQLAEEGEGAMMDDRYKSGWYTHRLLIGFALFFLVLTTGLVAALIVYRNYYADDGTTTDTTTSPASPTSTSTSLGEIGNPLTWSPSPYPTPWPTRWPTTSPTVGIPTNLRPHVLARGPTRLPTWAPTGIPTWMPTGAPSFKPFTDSPTRSPTSDPSAAPTGSPTKTPTGIPTGIPTAYPTFLPTTTPTAVPTGFPTSTELPSAIPSFRPSREPTISPTKLSSPPSSPPTTEPTPTLFLPTTAEPTPTLLLPTVDPSVDSDQNTTIVIVSPADVPTTTPSDAPTTTATTTTPSIAPATTVPITSSPVTRPPVAGAPPVSKPTTAPTSSGSVAETTLQPSNNPTSKPTPKPSQSPVTEPTSSPPTVQPTPRPTPMPTDQPSPEPTNPVPTRTPTGTPTNPPSTASPSTQPPVPFYVELGHVKSFLLEYSPMSTDELDDEQSTQYQALVWLANWMASVPPQELGRITKRRLVQRWALAVLYLDLNGPNWTNGSSDWMGEEDSCVWLRNNNQGTCNAAALVMTLDLSSNNLRGTLPKEIALLSSGLTRLEMDRNDISGPLPIHFGRMRQLVSLDFTRCDLTGSIPTHVGDLQSLAILGFGRNDFVGSIPTEIGKLSNLVYLGMERNDIRGTIPTEITALTNLEYIALDWNALTGEVPPALSNLSSLRTLILARNSLEGEVPSEFCERSMDFVAADCDEVSCSCCDLCCENGQGCAST